MTDEQDVISVDREIDRIYVEAPDQLKVGLLDLHQLHPVHSHVSIYGRVSSFKSLKVVYISCVKSLICADIALKSCCNQQVFCCPSLLRLGQMLKQQHVENNACLALHISDTQSKMRQHSIVYPGTAEHSVA